MTAADSALFRRTWRLQETLLAVGLVVLALAVRLWRLKDNEVFFISDEASYHLAALDLFHPVVDPAHSSVARSLYEVAAFPYGPLHLVVYGLWIGAASLAGIPLTEWVLTLPAVLMGAATVALLFLLGRALHSTAAGALAALWAAVMPLCVGQYRTVNGSPQIACLFLLLALLCFWRYVRSGGARGVGAASATLGLYVLADNQFPAIAPVLLYLAWAASREQLESGSPWRRWLGLVFQWKLLLGPLLALGGLAAVWLHRISRGDPTGGMLGHLFSKKGAYVPGFHWAAVEGVIYSCGGALATLAGVALLYGIRQATRGRPVGAAALWGLGYLAPWFFLLNLTADHRAYYLQGLLGLLIAAGALTVDAGRWAKVRLAGAARGAVLAAGGLGVAAVTALTAAATLFIVFDVRIPALAAFPAALTAYNCPSQTASYCDSGPYRYLGSAYRPNWGLKAAGVYLRSETPPGTRVFTEVDTAPARFYFGRPVYNDMDMWFYHNAAVEDKYRKLGGLADRIDVVVARACNAAVVRRYLPPEFHLAAEVTTGGAPALVIWRKGPAPPVMRTLTTEEEDPVFNRTYANIRGLMMETWLYREPFYN